jgi:hypothetical protein
MAISRTDNLPIPAFPTILSRCRTFRKVFQRVMGLSPADYRRRFAVHQRQFGSSSLKVRDGSGTNPEILNVGRVFCFTAESGPSGYAGRRRVAAAIKSDCRSSVGCRLIGRAQLPRDFRSHLNMRDPFG